MKAIVSVFLAVLFSILAGCSTTSIVSNPHKDKEHATVDVYQTSGQAVARAANIVTPAINDINTCPEGMVRVGHKAGGSASSTVHVTEQGTRFSISAEGGQHHKCQPKGK
ncbi:MAG: hypothetical protein KBC62_00470 [Candidatus Pacebacteria bacterium]|nr:hypothetical protein [Candidatus Paceibacterota bacterium]